MAEEKQETKIILERSYTIPLRREFLKAPTHKRTNRAVRAVRQFLQKHMKADNVKLGKSLNLKLWENGMKNPPHKVKINAIKDSEGTVMAELTGKEILLKEKKTKKEEAGVAEKLGLKQEEKEIPAQTYKPKSDEEKQSSQQDEKEVKTESEKESENISEKKEEISAKKEDENTTQEKQEETTPKKSKENTSESRKTEKTDEKEK
ncbi:MAG: 50S ribosomal protein L31e [Candidatus Nanoarchaeia archaeon]